MPREGYFFNRNIKRLSLNSKGRNNKISMQILNPIVIGRRMQTYENIKNYGTEFNAFYMSRKKRDLKVN